MASGLDPAGPSLEQLLAMLGTAQSPALREAPPAVDTPPDYANETAATFPANASRGTFLDRLTSGLANTPDIPLPSMSSRNHGSVLERALFSGVQAALNARGQTVNTRLKETREDLKAHNEIAKAKASLDNRTNAARSLIDERARMDKLEKAAKAAQPSDKTVTVMIDGQPKQVSATSVYNRQNRPPKAPTSIYDAADRTALATADRLTKDAERNFRQKYWGAKYPNDPETYAKMVRVTPPPGSGMEADPGWNTARQRLATVRANALYRAYDKSKDPKTRAQLDQQRALWEAETPGVQAALVQLIGR